MGNYTETEIKMYVPHLELVQIRLDRLGARLTAPRVYEHNVRYENTENTLVSSGIVVRLRQDSRARLTYKDSGSVREGIISRFEAEVEVSDFDTMQTILGKLGYHPYMIYEKYRTTYELDEAEIVLDELPYGNFVEIEAPHEQIEHLIQQLALSDQPRMNASYAGLFEQVKRRLGLDFTDLTFANFKGIHVPESVFVSV
ncbi:MAG: class IV adenylate cyclase [Anaerolineaceae bacterium]|nr:class IV adenylate cyclase [Anaerolineaceae bacterium]